MPTTAGIICIVVGAGQIIVGFLAAVVGTFVAATFSFGMMSGVGALVGIPLMICGVIALLGGIAAVRRRTWGLALAGAIFALFPPHISILGILAIIFVALSKKEFTS